jgi:DNA-binding CsgD family transcriptional regulator
MPAVQVVLFDGSEEEARVEAIHGNTRHGLPLTLSDRKRAATWLIAEHTDWSDGRIAAICSISPKTVASLRRAQAPAGSVQGDRPHAARRLGRDGKHQPVERALIRARVAEALARSPDASLRFIAVEAGVSPETVRTVRRSLGAGSAGSAQSASPLPTTQSMMVSARSVTKSVSDDGALAPTSATAQFAAWFDHHRIEDGVLRQYVRLVPTSRVKEVVDEARSRARFWAEFAARVEGRASPSTP